MTIPTLHTQTLPEFLAQDRPPPELIFHPWLPRGGIAMIYGKRGGGKTNVAVGLALAQACGTSLLSGIYAPRPKRVLYIDGEMDPGSMQGKFRKLVAGMPGVWATPNLTYLTHADYDAGIPDLAFPRGAGQALIEAAVLRSGADLLLLDNISSLFRSAPENDNDAWVPCAEWLLSFRRQGCSTLLVHHAGKRNADKELRQRGGSRREDLMDCVIQIDDSASVSDGRVPLRWTWEKHRAFTPDAVSFDFTIRFDDAAGRAWFEEADDEARDPDWLAQALALSGEGHSERKISEALGVPKTTLHRYLEKRGGPRSTPPKKR